MDSELSRAEKLRAKLRFKWCTHCVGCHDRLGLSKVHIRRLRTPEEFSFHYYVLLDGFYKKAQILFNYSCLIKKYAFFLSLRSFLKKPLFNCCTYFLTVIYSNVIRLKTLLIYKYHYLVKNLLITEIS